MEGRQMELFINMKKHPMTKGVDFCRVDPVGGTDSWESSGLESAFHWVLPATDQAAARL